MTTKWAGNGESLTGTPKVWASTMVVGLTTMATWPGPRGSGLENTRSPGCTAPALAAARPTGLTPSAIWPRPTVHGLPIQTVAFLGFVSFGSSHDSDNDRRTGEIYSLYVDPAYWSRGIGAAPLPPPQVVPIGAHLGTSGGWGSPRVPDDKQPC